MTSAALFDATAATYDDSTYSLPFQEDDTVRCGDNPGDCKIIGTWSDWLWRHPLRSVPSTGLQVDYLTDSLLLSLVRRQLGRDDDVASLDLCE